MTPTARANQPVWNRLLIASNPAMNAMAPPREIQNATTPADMTRPSKKRRVGCPAARLSPMILSGITGSTQGVTLSIRPPSAASTRRSVRPTGPFGSNSNDQAKTLILNAGSTAPELPSATLPKLKSVKSSGSFGAAITSASASATTSGTVSGTVRGG